MHRRRPPRRPCTDARARGAGTGGGESRGFLAAPEPSPGAQQLYDDEVAEMGVVTNSTRLWAHLPAGETGLFDLLEQVAQATL